MLLTSSQVSVAVSSGIVVVFTTALFLSGYAIQQRTLRELRAAIKPSPKPSPYTFLPDRFSRETTELPDGTVVYLDPDPESRDSQQSTLSGGRDSQGQQVQVRIQDDRDQRSVVVEVRPTVDDSQSQWAVSVEAKAEVDQELRVQPGKRRGRDSWFGSVFGSKRSGSKAKGNRNTEAEEDRPDKPLSAAARRKKIKDEIRRLSQGEERGYYQRRLW